MVSGNIREIAPRPPIASSGLFDDSDDCSVALSLLNTAAVYACTLQTVDLLEINRRMNRLPTLKFEYPNPRKFYSKSPRCIGRSRRRTVE